MTLSKAAGLRRSDVDLQRNYYADTADRYDDLLLAEEGEHDFALQFMISVLENFGIGSIP